MLWRKNEYPVSAYRTAMKYYEDFKVLQIADLHLGVETDVARELEILKNTIRTEVPAHVEMMGLIGAGNNPMVGMTVAGAVAIEEASK